MKIFRQEERKENILYAIVWAAAFLLPALRISMECIIGSESSIDFLSIMQTWFLVLPFFIVFLVHNYFAAPLLVYRSKTGLYVVITALLLVAVVLYYSVLYSGPNPGMIPPEPDGRMQGPPPGGMRGRPIDPNLMRVFLAVFMLAANLGMKFFFHEQNERDRMRQLENDNLNYQLEYLRYQINPHFFMNTLNNIHALVDIDPERAKSCIVELSKLMRHILYDSDKPVIPIAQELDYLDNYMSLMRIRYPEDARIEFSRPDATGDSEVPPLVFASFVENAFKHGPGTSKDAFVRFSVREDGGKVIFKCANSRQASSAMDGGKGIGLQNIRKRLQLLYGDAYTLHIEESPELYDILLVIPSKRLSDDTGTGN